MKSNSPTNGGVTHANGRTKRTVQSVELVGVYENVKNAKVKCQAQSKDAEMHLIHVDRQTNEASNGRATERRTMDCA